MPVKIPKLTDRLSPWVDPEGKPTTEFGHYMFMLDAYLRDVDTRLGVFIDDIDGAPNDIESLVIGASDETTALTAGTSKLKFRIPYAFTVTAVRASLSTAQASGNIFTVDVNDSGTSILSTKLTIDNTETTSTTAATPFVISDASLADDAEVTIDIDQIGNGSAKGLKVTLIGRQT